MTNASGPATSRRLALASLAGLTVGSAGCVKRVRNIAGHNRPERMSLAIKAPSADADPFAIGVARRLANHLQAVGVGARVVPVTVEELHRQVLIDTDFDLYVGQFPATDRIDPDELYPLLHSKFTSEAGWQNPFGYTDLGLDELLERQRRTSGDSRRRAVTDVLRHLARTLPFVVVAFPDHLTANRTDAEADWNTDSGVRTALGLLGAEPTDGEDDEEDDRTFRLTTTDPRITENRNPLAAEFRQNGVLTGLLYDPLVHRVGERFVPWLAVDWTWSDDDAVTATVTLRENLAWHDGESLTAEDVAFTYRLLTDTSLGEQESPVPASRFRGQSSLVDAAEAVDDRTVEVHFETGSREVALRALTVPILPEHVWGDRTDEASVVGVGGNGVTEALVWNNSNPVGSGPLQFDSAAAGKLVALERNDDHFLGRDSPERVPPRFRGRPAFDRLVVRVTASNMSAVELVLSGEADATLSHLGPDTVPRIVRSDALELTVDTSSSFYHLGFNTRRAPLSNPRFRKAVAGLLDKTWVVNETFGGYATPAATPLAGTRWEPDDLAWDGTDPVAPFAGTDGELDAERARKAFEEVGYRYHDGRLVRN